ncbi:hypothetical protein ACWCXH_08325 [Kitasatospora sp. NPDC001660]
MNEHASTSAGSSASSPGALLLRPVDTAASVVRRAPGARTVGGVVDGVLDTVGLVSPQARRIAAYTGAGLLGALGAVDWPVAAAGAAAVWLTQSRPTRTVAPTPAPKSARRKPAGKPSAGTRRRTSSKRRTTASARSPGRKAA